MEALVCKRLGDPTVGDEHNSPIVVSKTEAIPQVETPTGVRVRVKATSLNYANLLQIMGKYQEKPPLPFIPGSDFSGIVDAVGSDVTLFKVGDRVCSFIALGSYAQFIVADQSQLFPVPEGCDMVAAAALPVAFGTSHVALVHRAQLSTNQVLLVLGAAGGVGLSAVQIGKVCGAIVIAVARGAEKVQFLKSLGVDHVVDSSKESLITSVKDFLKARKLKGVDVLYDPVGGKTTKESLKLLNWGAQILIIGFASGDIPAVPVNIALVKVQRMWFENSWCHKDRRRTGLYMDCTGVAIKYIDLLCLKILSGNCSPGLQRALLPSTFLILTDSQRPVSPFLLSKIGKRLER
ncbi:hypothetical protein K2173_023468 [Erythroxylum novogranatense]|uniref:Enoyl reductase (ER) domain-containing protein n=1 Tax=Erythroxylum novogranatense TaxID=1862640 RepID=A0AAV8TYC9_9ROSI|nr:hypothetical protein K2173_023468 [Erythroxylum novogranatense]